MILIANADVDTASINARVKIFFIVLSFIWFELLLLFLAEIYLQWHTREVPMLAQVVLQEATIVLANILRQVAEEYKLRSRCRQLHRILDTDILTLG